MHAHDTFDIKMSPPSPGPAAGLTRFTFSKELHGDLEGTSQGEMLSGGDPAKAMAGYAALELVTGSLAGKSGSFALQHSATMKGTESHLNISVTPGSGTGELAGLEGTFTITIKDKRHVYDLEYTLPEK